LEKEHQDGGGSENGQARDIARECRASSAVADGTGSDGFASWVVVGSLKHLCAQQKEQGKHSKIFRHVAAICWAGGGHYAGFIVFVGEL
jgi:hypothetical protein